MGGSESTDPRFEGGVKEALLDEMTSSLSYKERLSGQLPSRCGGEGRGSSKLKDEKQEKPCSTEGSVWLVRGFECYVVARTDRGVPCCSVK